MVVEVRLFIHCSKKWLHCGQGIYSVYLVPAPTQFQLRLQNVAGSIDTSSACANFCGRFSRVLPKQHLSGLPFFSHFQLSWGAAWSLVGCLPLVLEVVVWIPQKLQGIFFSLFSPSAVNSQVSGWQDWAFMCIVLHFKNPLTDGNCEGCGSSWTSFPSSCFSHDWVYQYLIGMNSHSYSKPYICWKVQFSHQFWPSFPTQMTHFFYIDSVLHDLVQVLPTLIHFLICLFSSI